MAEDDVSSEQYAQVRFKGRGDRTLTAADFKRLGVEDQRMVVWDDSNDRLAGVTQAAADALVDQMGNEFERA